MTSQPPSPSVTDLLSKALRDQVNGCAVNSWVEQQEPAAKDLVESLAQNRKSINITRLYGDLSRTFGLPFGLTSFKAHLSGSCVCQKR